MTLTFSSPPDNPGTHVLAIGVGVYPHLVGGAGAPASDAAAWGMKQLSTPPGSAIEVARWFIDEHRNPACPLASVELLVSASVDAPFRPSRGPLAQQDVAIEHATQQNVVAAIKRWKKRLDGDEQSTGVFYFAGHGMQSGLSSFLLSETFGSDDDATMKDAIYFTGLHLGMERCLARRQIFLIDACRNAPQALTSRVAAAGGGAGADPVIEPRVGAHPSTLPRDAPIIYSTASEAAAFGPAGGLMSYFTSALLRALRGAGWDDGDDPWNTWVLRTDSLTRHIGNLMQLDSELHGSSFQAPRAGGDAQSFILHVPPPATPPRIPIAVQAARSDPASLKVTLGASVQQMQPSSSPWELELEAAPGYQIDADFADGARLSARLSARPTLRKATVVPGGAT